MKVATKNLWDSVEAKYMWGRDWMIVLHVHDEWQMYVRPEIAEEVGKMAVNAIKKAGEDLKMNCPLDGEYKIGQNWAETH
jgi:DNA polymerase I-like protein with 3'-5' exonuclease and polymerase domains